MVAKKLRIDQSVYDLALMRIRRTYELYDRVSVMFSGGKDSTVCLELTLQVARELGKLPLDVVFYDEEAIPPDTVDYCRRRSQSPDLHFRWLCCPIKHRNACSKREPYWYPWDPKKKDLWVRPLPMDVNPILSLPGVDGMLTPEINAGLFPPAGGTAGLIFGIRTDESLRRFRSVSLKSHDNYIAQDGLAHHVYIVKPIYDWSTQDVWAAPKLFGWDYNIAYDKMAMAGISPHMQRAAPPFGEEPIRGLWTFAVCWPELWEKMIDRVAGAATAGRLSRSPLYAYGEASVGEWNLEEHPHDLIKRAITKWDPSVQEGIRDRIRQEVTRHYKKYPGVPIPLEVPGDDGVSWRWLYMLVYRGDLKGRRTAKISITRAGATAASRKLERERREKILGGIR